MKIGMKEEMALQTEDIFCFRIMCKQHTHLHGKLANPLVFIVFWESCK